MRTLSITTAWNEALGILRREGSLLLPVALAFFGLPIVLFQLAVPQTPPGVQPEAGSWMLLIFPLALVTILGTLTITLLSLRAGMSVGEALRASLGRLLPAIGATLLLMVVGGVAVFVLMLFLAVLAGLGGGGENAATGLMLVVLLPLFAFVWARLMMMLPVNAAEGVGPVAIIRRSWQLTRGHAWKLFGFAVLVSVGVGIIALAVTIVLGSLVALVLGRPEPANLSFVLLLLIGGSLNALWGAFYAVIVARIYAQLAGEPTSGI